MSIACRVALAVAAVLLFLAGWLDNNVMTGFRQQFLSGYDAGWSTFALELGQLALAAAVVLLVVLAWRSRSSVVGWAYTIVGAFFLGLQLIVWLFAFGVNNTPPVAPAPIADFLVQLRFDTYGPLNATPTVGAGMVIGGLLVLGRRLNDRLTPRASERLAIDTQLVRE